MSINPLSQVVIRSRSASESAHAGEVVGDDRAIVALSEYVP
jgi:hypothetical protein